MSEVQEPRAGRVPTDAEVRAGARAGQALAVHWGHQPWSDSWAALVAKTILAAARAGTVQEVVEWLRGRALDNVASLIDRDFPALSGVSAPPEAACTYDGGMCSVESPHYHVGRGGPMSARERLTDEQLRALPDGTPITVTWSGGNGPHEYRLLHDSDGTPLVDNPYRDPLRAVLDDVRRAGEERADA